MARYNQFSTQYLHATSLPIQEKRIEHQNRTFHFLVEKQSRLSSFWAPFIVKFNVESGGASLFRQIIRLHCLDRAGRSKSEQKKSLKKTKKFAFLGRVAYILYACLFQTHDQTLVRFSGLNFAGPRGHTSVSGCYNLKLLGKRLRNILVQCKFCIQNSWFVYLFEMKGSK